MYWSSRIELVVMTPASATKPGTPDEAHLLNYRQIAYVSDCDGEPEQKVSSLQKRSTIRSNKTKQSRRQMLLAASKKSSSR